MADYNEKCWDCSFDYGEDKQKGVCLIKEEFIIEDHVRQLSDQCLTKIDKQKVSTDANVEDTEASWDQVPAKKAKLEDKREKLRGQNKARPPPFKVSKELSLCPWIADQTANELERKCSNQRCTFLHDRKEYLKIRPEDIGTECYIFNLTGKCPRGTTCRMGSGHLTEDGFNIIDKKKLEEYSKFPPAVKNYLSKDLQNKLRKHKYNFSRAEAIVKANGPSMKKTQLQSLNSKREDKNDTKSDVTINISDNSNGEKMAKHISDNANDEKMERDASNCNITYKSEELKIGPVDDSDLIRLRQSEKKTIDWNGKILLSPLTTVGNLPFRRICKEYGADITCGEMALAPNILKGTQEEWALVKRHESEDIFGVQLCGNNPGVLARCAQLLNHEIDADYIDLNLGCPIDMIYKNGGGSGMLNRLNVLETVIKSVSQVLDIPLSVKTRTGVYIDKPIAHNLMPRFRDWGVSMITVHGRSREQRYTKLADWEYIEKCAMVAQPIPVFGNGDILSFDDYHRAKEIYSTVQGITIGRGALIKPWIFTEIKEKKLIDISSVERFDILKKYANYGLEHWGSDTRGVENTRRFMLEWISFLHRYIPVGILERPPQRINERPPFYRGRNDMETLMASSNCADWVKLSEMLLGKVPDGFRFLPKHKANSWK
ncbi:PREDICTED: tRNA-dihydrouridine(47) synthase [NAD(P)(+)]-like [Trachymyrmex cornetzi]|uniref:tRNA-dihydrouridine(47) synthase [NAD(P)(+)] n=1 Tax=Trachymyrmex cornetzi TaxID=471704 RepID=A0A195DL54_9HYME|nr:PREDICTED: tRNA-dihydrouridine(47) synthase [NAD(P)(+)]-like [Trachymyrmex cornetzi]XP_018371420.1 PREDICTED: tRNA-dihydrouridine(47) synthase [NAD(P)(+)]-like [Trachymyrmex cornetzi]XP_018371421.1 PREDICTED: tRNA-dihydrouridine(47) synthase [NAD(P)(+)]-like [Trachymyrmex cornetzi]KYN13576.1 tRNA-dihydrouridine synthase 3-like protein [Trachymyrmex cornetzi]